MHRDLGWLPSQWVRLHLASCSKCQAKIARLYGVRGMLRTQLGPGPALSGSGSQSGPGRLARLGVRTALITTLGLLTGYYLYARATPINNPHFVVGSVGSTTSSTCHSR